MEWKQTSVLVVILLTLSILLYSKTFDYHRDIIRMNMDISAIDEAIIKRFQGIQTYMETRLNRVSASQDEYQFSSSKRMDRLESRVSKLEESKLRDLKNNNSNVNINNVYK